MDWKPKATELPYLKLALTTLVCKIFNHLSNDIKNLPLTTFKRKLRSYLIEKCFYNLDEFFNNNNNSIFHQ